MKVVIVVFLSGILVCDGLFFGLFGDKPEWDGLKVTWGINPLSDIFSTLPRTIADANKNGFRALDSSSGCSGQFLGQRYIKGDDHAVILLFDMQGYIAGIQVGVKKGQKNGYPFPSQRPPFNEDGDYNYLTAYFVDPSMICTKGRSAADFKSEGTGTGLYIQNGTNPLKDLVRIPQKPADLSNTKWVKGKCFPTMGLHYWYNLSVDLNCNEMFPVFLLYNGGKLNGFGWAMTTGLNSTRYEHPTPDVFSKFMTTVPTCLNTIGPLSTMHVYLTSKPLLDFC